VWSGDGKSIAFLAEGEPKACKFLSSSRESRPPSQLTRLTEETGQPSLVSGRQVDWFTANVAAPEKCPVDLPAAPEGANGPTRRRYTGDSIPGATAGFTEHVGGICF